LHLFALTNLVIGTGAFVLTGILKPMGDSLGISVAAAGQAITAYAIASALLAPLACRWASGWVFPILITEKSCFLNACSMKIYLPALVLSQCPYTKKLYRILRFQ
jgi:hypothetical protein